MEPPDEYFNGNDDEFDQENFDEMINTRPFPWLKVVIKIYNDVDLHCDHEIKCQSNCYEKKMSSCRHLIQALSNMFQLSPTHSNPMGSSFSRSSSSTHRSTSHLKRNDTTSSKTHHDPKKRRVKQNENNEFFQFDFLFSAFDVFVQRWNRTECGKCRIENRSIE